MQAFLKAFVGGAVLFCHLSVFSQNCDFSGKIYDEITDEGLAVANIFYNSDQSITADLEGDFAVSLPYGTYNFEFSYVGYKSQVLTVNLNKASKKLDVGLRSVELNEAIVTADIAIDRETPVAFSNIDAKTINEELASQDIPMILNTTPGVYATQQGGGDGDARITIRGFDQRNIAVMLDGVPVNDMENGWVYWSNWFGLDAILQTTQVQRGLGISKLAVPSVGGTINIITKGIDQKKDTKIKQEVSNNGFLRTTFGHTSGRLKGGWGFTVAGSYKQGNGWVDGNFTKGFFYYGKVQKAMGNHVFTLSGFGAPQNHGQRVIRGGIGVYDAEVASNLGAELNEQDVNEFGIGHNFQTADLLRYDLDANGNRINEKAETLNSNVNYYHKPQFSFRHSWNMSDKLSLNSTAYLSIGNGGGTRLDKSFSKDELLTNGGPDYQSVYDIQTGDSFEPTPFVSQDPTIIPGISNTEHAATENYLQSGINNHFWYGLLSSMSYKMSDKITLSGGLDVRSYKGGHYREVYDLLGADYLFDTSNQNSATGVKREGDIIDYHNDAFVQWGGLFGQVEYKNDLWSGFLSGSYAMTRYKRIDYMLPRSVTVDGVDIAPVYFWETNATSPTLIEETAPNGQVYTAESPELSYQETDWYYKGGFTVKSGFNRKINEKHNFFVNLGYLDRAPRFQNVFDFGNKLFSNIENELIQAVEFGYGFKTRPFSLNLNSYYTTWQNRPVNRGVQISDPQDPEEFISANVNGMNARHMGAELEAAYAVNKKLTLEGIVSLGDWIWDTKDTVLFYYDDGTPVVENGVQRSVSYDARGVHVGDAAQTQLGGLIRYEFKRGAYVKLRYTFFDRHYANFNPNDLNGDDAGRDSWQVPSYGLLDFHAGYRIKLRDKYNLNLRGSLFNILDKRAISDASVNDNRAVGSDSPTGAAESEDGDLFDANSAGVFFVQGTRLNISATLNF
tara:strand:+ start:2469 stop:5339 length:2871 start_codon:yes stop_codon:yes gene_type:complete